MLTIPVPGRTPSAERVLPLTTAMFEFWQFTDCGWNLINKTMPLSWPHDIVYFKHMALFTYGNEISLPVNMEDLPILGTGHYLWLGPREPKSKVSRHRKSRIGVVSKVQRRQQKETSDHFMNLTVDSPAPLCNEFPFAGDVELLRWSLLGLFACTVWFTYIVGVPPQVSCTLMCDCQECQVCSN